MVHPRLDFIQYNYEVWMRVRLFSMNAPNAPTLGQSIIRDDDVWTGCYASLDVGVERIGDRGRPSMK